MSLAAACTGPSTSTPPSPADDTAATGDTGHGGGSVGPTSVTADHPDLRYVGRWDLTDPAAPALGWQGGSVALRFEGTGLDVHLDAGNRTEGFRVIVDGDDHGSRHFMAEAGAQTLELVTDLDEGTHTVELVKETYVGTSLVLDSFEIDGAGILEAPPTASRHLAFYGDSNLAGYSLMSERNQSPTRFWGCHLTFAGITARAFDADYQNIAVSGETLDGMTRLYDRLDWYAEAGSWDFDRYVPDVVVMNLGANDIFGADEDTIRDRYVTMLDLLRAAHPEAHIVVFNGWGWDFDEPADYTAEVVAAYGDPNISVETFPWVFEQWHGAETDHAGMARVLIAHLEETLGWASSPPEIMSGYGEDGDVANGSFEEVAPFGGWGWRYFDDEGVARITDEDAHEGNAFLRLEDGAETHQPNPARDGETVEATLWLRGSGTASLTVDFRNQTMWSDPLDSTTETISLTETWTAHTVSATAPSGTSRPVFHTRLTIAAGSGSTVDIDAISMTTE